MSRAPPPPLHQMSRSHTLPNITVHPLGAELESRKCRVWRRIRGGVKSVTRVC
ncbi:unnamed protein product [Staurois parvus]|uniref:Uncharacterized protein n=1 Tax=Staurois parvus TaxID=386267 RepID=A0ABN9G0N4_9NEOB|nr:unnamed protein product [Staurois parvus]